MNRFDDAQRSLSLVLTSAVVRDEPLARHCSWRIGGPAALFARFDSWTELRDALEVLAERAIAWKVIGAGTNLLIGDTGFQGCVLTPGPGLRAFELRGACEDGKSVSLTAGAGCLLTRLVQAAASAGLGGLEFACGIPGTVAGAVVGNAGTSEGDMAAVLRSATVFEPGAGLRLLRSGDLRWGYRHSSLADAGVVIDVELALQPGDKAIITRKMKAAQLRRQGSQPTGAHAGSVFRNPREQYAGALIEGVGLKGKRIGGAVISEQHANFIINNGEATAADVVALIRLAQEKVERERGIVLKTEVKFFEVLL